MDKFTLRIELGNDAMQTPYDVARALQAVASRLMGGDENGGIRDANGNSVGSFSGDFEESEDSI